MRKNWLYPPTASGSYIHTYGWLTGWLTGRQGNEIRMSFEFLKTLYRFNYLGFNFVEYHCNATTELERHFSQVKHILICVFKCEKFSCHFSCQSLLLCTSVPNDVVVSNLG